MTSGIRVDFRYFLDRADVLQWLSAKTRRALQQAGGRLRVTAQRSMRYRRGPAPPGAPPHAHREQGALVRKRLFYVYDPRAESVVVGPERFGSSNVLELLEHGGTARRRVLVKSGRRAFSTRQAAAYRKKLHAGDLERPAQAFEERSVDYEPRPFMGPALAEHLPTITDLWAE